MARTSETTSPRWRGGMLRMLIESAAMLAISVSVFRTFAAQGYMIETGSMAPGLLGYHRRAVCPSCRHSFSIGESRASGRVSCPNCGQGGIDGDSLPRNDGDQLLVSRGTFDLQAPHRWGVVVFRNPSNPLQAFVKRIAGLPGEELQIRTGDIYIDGQIQTKSLETQRSMRVLVHDNNQLPDDRHPDWQPRWAPDPNAKSWEAHGPEFGFEGLPKTAPAKASPIELTSASQPAPGRLSASTAGSKTGMSYVRYRHWIRSGGKHRTSVRVGAWPENVPLPERAVDILDYDSGRGALVCQGTLPAQRRDELKKGAPREFQAAIEELYEGSHISPILDVYGYNGTDIESGRREVRDLCLALRLEVVDGMGQFAIGLNDGTGAYECRFDLGKKELRIVDAADGHQVRSLPLPGSWPGSAEIELSLMDRQLGLAVNGWEVFTWNTPEGERGTTPWRPAWFGAEDLRARVSNVRLYRDVHYTGGDGSRGYDEPVKLGPREYFVLGDNSPVSRDSRSWEPGHVLTSELILGKPFLVHLPSHRGRVQIGSWKTEVRIPDFSRMRYIR